MCKRQLSLICILVFLLSGNAGSAVIDGSAITTTQSHDDWGQLPASNLVNGMGLDANGLYHINKNYGTWEAVHSGANTSAAAGTTPGPAWVKFAFDDTYKLGQVWVWNGNLSGIGAYYAMRNVIIEYSLDGNTWYNKGTYELPKGTGETNYPGFSACNFNGTSAKYVAFTAADIDGNWGYPNVYMLSEVRFNGTSDYATQANPKNHSIDVSINTDLSWFKGDSAAVTDGHQIYFGTSYYGVSNATPTVDPCSVYKGTGSSCNYDPGALAYNTTYYWRVDEVNGVNTWKGCVRQFTTDFNASIHWSSITATASNDSSGAYPASLIKNCSGFDVTRLLHSTNPDDMWLAASSGNSQADLDTTSGPAWVMFQFDHVCELQNMWVWNCNDGATNRNRGLRDIAVEYSADGQTWSKLGDYTFPQASGLANDPGFSACNFNGAKARYVVITAKSINGNWGGGSYYSLSEVRFYGSQSSTTRQVKSGVPWTMQYDAANKKPTDTGAVVYADGTTGYMSGSNPTYATAENNDLRIDTYTPNCNTGCYFCPSNSVHVNPNSTTGYTVEWRVKLLSADTSTENSACSISANTEVNKCWVAGLVIHNNKVWSHQYYVVGEPCEVMLDTDATNPDYHTLRVCVEAGYATLYVDGVYASHAALHNYATVYKVRFGDPSTNPDAKFLTDYFYIYDGGGITPKDFREPAKNRNRRVIFDNDGCDMALELQGTTVQEFWDDRMTGLIGTQTDTIVYCPISSGFGQFTYNTSIGDILTSKAGTLSNNKTADYIAQGTDSLKMTVDFCRKNDFEVFFSMRMNDMHDGEGYMEYFNQFKEDNPSWLFGTIGDPSVNGWWTGVDYTESGVRSHAFSLFEEVCQNYDVDGIMLDFFRHPVFFQSQADGGVASSTERQMMTDLVTDIREMADREGLKRGKPILIAARTPDDITYAENIGLDIETWMANSLIDLWVPTGYYRMDFMQDIVALGHQYDIPVYPCMAECRMSDDQAQSSRKTDRAYYAESQNWFHYGADGVYSFNYFINHASSAMLNTYPRLRKMGDPNTLTGLDKTYSTSMLGYSNIEYLYSGGTNLWNYDFVAPEKTLSLPASTPQSMAILVGENVATELPNVLLRLRFAALPVALGDLAVTLNNQSLTGYHRLELNSTTGYTVEWRIKMMEADAATGGYAGIRCSPEVNKYWYVFVLQHDDKNWVVLNDGSQIQLDSDKDNPAYHILRVTANTDARLYIDGSATPAATHAFHSGGPYTLRYGDLTSTADADYYVDYVRVFDDGAQASGTLAWTSKYEGSSRPSSASACSYDDGTTGCLVYSGESYSTVYQCADGQQMLHIDTTDSNNASYFTFDDKWINYSVNPADVIDGWNTIGMTLGAGKTTLLLEDLLIDVNY